jgi:hypothetical protein
MPHFVSAPVHLPSQNQRQNSPIHIITFASLISSSSPFFPHSTHINKRKKPSEERSRLLLLPYFPKARLQPQHQAIMQATISLEKRNPKATQSNFYLLARRAKEKENTRNPAHQPQIKLTKGRRKREWSTTIVSNVAA